MVSFREINSGKTGVSEQGNSKRDLGWETYKGELKATNKVVVLGTQKMSVEECSLNSFN